MFPVRIARSLTRPRAGSIARSFALALVTVSLAAVAPRALCAQEARTLDRQTYERGRRVLEQVRKDLRTYYYDSTYKGIDLDARFAAADSSMRAASNATQMFAIIAQYLADFNDSHTRFVPPSKVAEVDYGFRVQFVGDTAFVLSVRKDSDAEQKGLKPGDAVLALDRFRVERGSWRTLTYVYYTLSPRPALQLKVRSPGDAAIRELAIQAKVTMGERVVDYTNIETRRRLIQEYEDDARRPRHFFRTVGDSVLVWRMPSFIFGDERNIDDMLERARRHRALILDLRNNPGGSVATELYLLGGLVDRRLHVATLRTRQGDTLRYAEVEKRKPFLGPLVILVNSNSASASEITARTLQLAGRAMIIGDRTAGAVVTSISLRRDIGFERFFTYGMSVSVADVVMPDGSRLEGVGVIPDLLVLPTGRDIAERRDPQLARALETVGVALDPLAAARLFRGGSDR